MTETCEHLHREDQPADPAVGIMSAVFYCEDCGEDLEVMDEEVMTVKEADEIRAQIQKRAMDPNDPWNVSAPLPAGIFPNEEPPF